MNWPSNRTATDHFHRYGSHLRKMIYIFVLLNILIGCQLHNRAPLIPKNEKSEKERNNHLIVFVGEKVSDKTIPNEGGMDAAFYASYKVLQRVYGEYEPDTISFTIYDHYGTPEFLSDPHVLLFVTQYQGKYYLEKYQAIPVYRTKNEQWAGVYHPADYMVKTVVPEPIAFAETVSFPISSRKFYDSAAQNFPAPYFIIRNDMATAVYGNYVKELFRLKAEDVLAYRGLFDFKDSTKMIVQDVQLEEVSPDEPPAKKEFPTKYEYRFRRFWKTFAASLRNEGSKRFRAAALDSLQVCDSIITADHFMDRYYNKFFEKNIVRESQKQSNHQFRPESFPIQESLSYPGLLPCAKERALLRDSSYQIYQVDLKQSFYKSKSWSLSIGFIETAQGYSIYKCSIQGSRHCY